MSDFGKKRTFPKFAGMFRSSAGSFAQAPTISNVHMENGEVAESEGFIVKQEQKFVIVKNCSSSGEISSQKSGGIVGKYVGGDGKIVIEDCSSKGDITGDYVIITSKNISPRKAAP